MYIKKLFDYLKPLARNLLCNLIASQNRAYFRAILSYLDINGGLSLRL